MLIAFITILIFFLGIQFQIDSFNLIVLFLLCHQ